MTDFRKWRMEFEDMGSTAKQLPAPPGFDKAAGREVAARSAGPRGGDANLAVVQQAKQRALVDRATGAFKSIGLLCFMMWMSGSQLHIFSIMSTMSGVFQPLSAILSSGKLFEEEDKTLETRKPQLLYCGIQLLGLGYALYKLNGMGLLPTHLSDYASLFTVPQPQEYSSGVVI